jgi:tRNA G26 N,N-dimethylase Trm1
MKDYKNKCVDCQCRVDNRTKRCLTCYKKWRDSTKQERKQAFRNYQKKWYEENKERIIPKNAEKARNRSFSIRKSYTIKHKYGITIQKYNSMLKECEYKCEICGKLHTEEKPLNIDHCHNSREVRGLLCHSCNYGLGFFQDDIKLMNKAIKYLKNEI